MIKVINKYKYLLIVLGIVIISIIYLSLEDGEKLETSTKNDDNVKVEKPFSVTSSAFKNGDYIPVKYSLHGEDISIPLEFNNVNPSGKYIAIIMDDPDAPTASPFVHWLIWNIPTTTKQIPEGIKTDTNVPSLNGAIQGRNDFGKVGYMGPKPPSGTHTYKIKVYVLDYFLNIEPSSSKEILESAMQGHILQSTLLEGKFSYNQY